MLENLIIILKTGNKQTNEVNQIFTPQWCEPYLLSMEGILFSF